MTLNRDYKANDYINIIVLTNMIKVFFEEHEKSFNNNIDLFVRLCFNFNPNPMNTMH